MAQSYEKVWKEQKKVIPLQREMQGTGCSAVGSAHVWGARGRKFESCHPDLRKSRKLNNKQSALSFLYLVSGELAALSARID